VVSVVVVKAAAILAGRPEWVAVLVGRRLEPRSQAVAG